MYRVFPALGLLLLATSCPHCAEVIGKDAVIPLPGGAFYSRFVVPQPLDGEEVGFNPPIFSWFYAPEYKLEDDGLYAFRFQVAEDPEFKNLELDQFCTYNFYNTLKPFKAKRLYWRVGYIPMPRTLDAAPDRNKVATWSRVRAFTIANNAVAWDRSMLADPNYLASHGGHPRLLISKRNLQAIRQHIETDPAARKLFERLRQAANQGMASPWWQPNAAIETGDERLAKGNDEPLIRIGRDFADKAGQLCAAAFVLQVSGDEEIAKSKPEDVLVYLSRQYMADKLCYMDQTRLDHSTPVVMLALSFDWLYDRLTAEQRKIVVEALERSSDFSINHFWWRHGVGRSWSFVRERNQGEVPGTGEFMMKYNGAAKVGDSHGGEVFTKPFYGALAAWDEPDARWTRELFEVGINYLIGKTYFAGHPDGGFTEGAGYVMSLLPQCVDLTIIADDLFPEAQLRLNPYFSATGRFLRHYFPAGLKGSYFGDGAQGCDSSRFGAVGQALALLAGDGASLQHLQATGGGSESGIYMDIVYPALLKAPELKSDQDLAVCFPLSGWAMAHSRPVSDPNSVKDGVGIIFPCRTQGGYSHSFFCDLSPQIYAYGQTLTYAETRMSVGMSPAIRFNSIGHNTILVDGIGQAQRGGVGYYGDKSFFGRIFAFRQGDRYVYFAGDATNCYPGEKFNPADSLDTDGKGVLKDDLAHLRKVRRHVLFMRNRYFILYDELESDSTKPARFAWLWHVVPEELITVAKDPLHFQWQLGDVRTHLVQLGSAADLEVQDLSDYSNPFTGVTYSKGKLLKKGDLDSAHNLWICNREPKSRFYFLTVIYPVKPGGEEPRIARLNDKTVEVSVGAEQDVVSFMETGTDAHPRATIAIDLNGLFQEDSRLLEAARRKRLGD